MYPRVGQRTNHALRLGRGIQFEVGMDSHEHQIEGLKRLVGKVERAILQNVDLAPLKDADSGEGGLCLGDFGGLRLQPFGG